MFALYSVLHTQTQFNTFIQKDKDDVTEAGVEHSETNGASMQLHVTGQVSLSTYNKNK